MQSKQRVRSFDVYTMKLNVRVRTQRNKLLLLLLMTLFDSNLCIGRKNVKVSVQLSNFFTAIQNLHLFHEKRLLD